MREYLEKMLHTKVESQSIDASRLPLFLRGLYPLEEWTAYGVPFVIAHPLENLAVKTMAKHREALETTLEIPVSFALEDATNYRIERMLEAGLPFVIENRQVYLPFLGIALNKGKGRSSIRPQTPAETFSPQVQRLALMALYGDLDGTSVTQAANLLGVTKMTASRAFDELAATDPSIVITEGRRRVLHPNKDRKELWKLLEPRMLNPVTREYHLDQLPTTDLPLGGISAVCSLSMLQDNPWPTFVATKEQERALGLVTDARPVVSDEFDEPACMVQVMRYEPVPAPGNTIDPLSAILSLPEYEREDPRIANEITYILNQVLGGNNEGHR